ncbi:hypothetical protein [Halosolutus halophilus]|uniref:hypothetical protein n=1 Tax=Halosolutus halophilus TaxID=1552990 RepID=UPI00223519BB|nr:hypothetical protein [Halosolutus halophilus]
MKQSRQWKVATIAAAIGLAAVAVLWQTSIEPGFFVRNFAAALWGDLQSGTLTINILSNVPGMKPWLAILSTVTGIPLDQIHNLPFGAAMRAVLYFSIVMHLTDRADIASMMGLLTLVYPWGGWGFNSIYVHSLGGFVFLSLVLLMLIMADSRNRPAYSMAGILLITALFFFDYTASVWAGVMLVVLAAIAYYRRELRFGSLLILSICAAVLYSLKRTITPFIRLWQDTGPLGVLFGTSKSPTSHEYPHMAESVGLGLSKIIYLLIGLACLGYVSSIGYHLYRRRDIRRTLADISGREYVIGAALIGGVVGTGLYTLMDRFTQFFIFLMAPIVGLVAIWYLPRYLPLPAVREHRSVIALVFVVALTGFVGIEFVYQMQTGDIDRNSQMDGEPIGTWLGTHGDGDEVQTDLMTAGRLRMSEEKHDMAIEWQWYDNESYATVVEGGDPPPDYTIVDLESEAGVRAIGGSWLRFESLGHYEREINNNPNMNRVYHDGTYATYT